MTTDGDVSYFVRVVLPVAMLPDKPSYNYRECAKALGVTYRTLCRMLRDGRLHSREVVYKGGTRKVVERAELVRYFSIMDGVEANESSE